jgi:hypothetical protein
MSRSKRENSGGGLRIEVACWFVSGEMGIGGGHAMCALLLSA